MIHLFEPVGLICAALFLLIPYELLIKRHIRSAVIVTISLFGFLMFATPLGANWMVKQIEVELPSATTCAENKSIPVVILAGGADAFPQNDNQFWYLSHESIRRTMEGLAFARSLNDPILILAGGEGYAIKESDMMASLAIKYGYPGEKIIKERRSVNTYHNSIYLADNFTGIDKHIWLVTSALHMPRAVAVFEKQRYRVCVYPVNHLYQDVLLPHLLIPQIDALRKSTAAVHEILGLTWYYLNDKV